MIYSNLFIVCVISVVITLPNDINGQQQPRPAQQPTQQLLQQPQLQPQRQPQPRPVQQRPQQQRPQQIPQRPQLQPRPQQPRPQQPRPQPARPQQPQQRPQLQQPQRPQPQPQQPQGQCSPRGGNCQQNSDCCSTSCLQQRCQRSVQEIQQEIGQGYSGSNVPFWHVPGGMQYNNIDDLLGSIYEDGQTAGNSRPATTPNRPVNNNVGPAINNNRPTAVTNPNSFQQLNRNIISNSLGSRFGGNDESPSTAEQTSGQCFEIGAKCTRGLECCSTRCHGFLHKCVV